MKFTLSICTLLSIALIGCGGGGDSSADTCAATGACSTLSTSGNAGASGFATGTTVALAGGTTSDSTVALAGAATSGKTAAASSSTVAPAPNDIVLGDWPSTMLQTGTESDGYWLQDGVWGAGELKRGKYTGLNGTAYQQSMGISPTVGSTGEVAGRITWAWPTGTTEVKSYMAFLAGNKPGWANTWITPGGYEVRLPNGTARQVYPSGKTPGTIFPMQLPIASLKSSASFKHNAAPTGRGHLSYDIWLQSTPEQVHGFNAKGEITHEIMIPLDYWGGYGAYPHRNPSWYSHDATIDGRLWHIYFVRNFPTGEAGKGWTFVVFQPDKPGIQPESLNVAAFINYLTTQKDKAGAPWAKGNEYAVSVELGVEPFDGTGDLTMHNFRVWK